MFDPEADHQKCIDCGCTPDTSDMGPCDSCDRALCWSCLLEDDGFCVACSKEEKDG